MKFITKIIPVFTILIATLLSITFLDVKQSKTYLNSELYQSESIRINYDETMELDESVIKSIIDLAQSQHVILQKMNYADGSTTVRNIYLSVNTPQELYQFLSGFQLTKLNNETQQSFISTYQTGDHRQMAVIPDLLENDHYNYYMFSKLLEDNGNLYGEYTVYYHNYHDFEMFQNDVTDLLNQDIRSSSHYHNLQSDIIIVFVISIVVLMLFYFIFQIYEIYHKSQHVGCMKLLGYSNQKITNLFFKKSMKGYLVFGFLLLIGCLLLVRNITWLDFSYLLLIHLLLIVITYFIHYGCVRIITQEHQLSNLLKKQNLALKISNISMNLKGIVAVIFIVLLSIVVQNLLPLYEELKEYRSSKDLLNYGVISSFHSDTKEMYEYEKQSKLYELITNDHNLNTFYANFDYYSEMTKEEETMTNLLEQNGTFIRYASVDQNYLKKEKMIVYDQNNHVIDLNKINGIFFLFPKSQKDKIKGFQNFYLKYSKKDYDKYHIDSTFQAYLYDDQTLNSYRLNLKIKYVDSPIMRVVDKTLKISYLESPLGINTLGTSLTTGLKIEIPNTKEETFSFLEQDIKKAGLQNLIGKENFVSYRDYFADEIKTSRYMTLTVLIVFSIILLVYTMITIQVISLYVKSENRKVSVKYLLGFEREKIFSKIIKRNMIYHLGVFIVSGLILNLLDCFYFVFYLLSLFIFIVIDSIILFIIMKRYRFSNIYLQLKGENYD